MNRNLEKLYGNRFSKEKREKKSRMWRCLVEHHLQRFFGQGLDILDLGCGFCEFINSVQGAKKYGLDVEDAFAAYAGEGVTFLKAEPGAAIPLPDGSCDRVFASNFFEHLSSREEVLHVLGDAFRVLRPGGRIVTIQPNVALVPGAYWDFFDHIIPLTEKSLMEAMEMAGFERVLVKRRFLPYATNGSRAAGPLLLRVYLALPPLHRIFGKQSLIICGKPNG